MSHITDGHKGVELVGQEKWTDAIPLLTRAIKESKSPAWLLARAQAYQQTGQLERALVDAEHAYLAATERQSPKRNEQMTEAQHRRGVALHRLGRLADADACFYWAMRLAMGCPAREEDAVLKKVDQDGFYKATAAEAAADKPPPEKNSDLASATKQSSSKWIKPYTMRTVVLNAMEKLPTDAPGRKLSVTRTPTPPKLVNGEYSTDKTASAQPTSSATTNSTPAAAAAPAPPKEQKLRFDFFQSNTSVTLSVFVKGVDKSRFSVEPMGARTVVLHNVPRDSNPDVLLALDHDIVPGETRHTVGTTKVELTLAKANPGEKWRSWGKEMTESDAATVVASVPASPAPHVVSQPLQQAAKTTSGPPAYPTSSKSGPKDWEKLGDGPEEEADADVESFMKNLYARADPESQRAMMKSFLESNGTELSTDWSDVKDRKVPVHPPEGVEAKKW